MVDMQVPGCSSEIARLLKMRGVCRLKIKNELTEVLLKNQFNYLKLRFLETSHKETEAGSWDEYYILIGVPKIETSSEYLGAAFKLMTSAIKRINSMIKSLGINVQNIGIQEVECGLPDYYYFLIYIHNNGTEIEED